MYGRFGSQLKSLLNAANVKNATIAKALKYDVSYISKWASGKALPSERNAQLICSEIGTFLSGLDDSDSIFFDYANGDTDIKHSIEKILHEAYLEDKRSENDDEFESMTMPVVGEEQFFKLIDYENLFKADQNRHIVSLIDFFRLRNESRLICSAIRDGRFIMDEANSGSSYNMFINLPDEGKQKDVVYDAISLVHMLTGLSHIKFNLYKNKYAKDRMSVSSSGEFYSNAVNYGSKGSWCSFSKCTKQADVNAYINLIESRIENDALLFRRTSMKSLLVNHEYLQSILSTDVRWLFGHITELLCPEEIFKECLEYVDDEAAREEMIRAHSLIRNVLDTCNVKIMIYDSALTDLGINGNLDFFNIPVKLDSSQCAKVAEYILNIAAKHGNVRIVKGGFSPDYKYITNPCMFMSENICYLRLENGTYKDNLLVLNDVTIKKMFDDFYSTIWEKRRNVVIDDPEQVTENLNHYLERMKLM